MSSLKKSLLLLIACFLLPLALATSAPDAEPAPANAREVYLKALETKLDSWDDKMGRLKETASKQNYLTIEDLQLQTKNLRGELLKAREVATENWPPERAKIERRVKAMEANVAKVVAPSPAK